MRILCYILNVYLNTTVVCNDIDTVSVNKHLFTIVVSRSIDYDKYESKTSCNDLKSSRI